MVAMERTANGTLDPDVLRDPQLRRKALGDFLTAKRKLRTARQMGMERNARRHDQDGELTRKEVVQLAGAGEVISLVWYTRLEQGKAQSDPSSKVLQRLADALDLDSADREHLFTLAGRPVPPTPPDKVKTVSPHLHRLITAFNPLPAVVQNQRWDVLDWNEAFAAVFGDPSGILRRRRNIVWLMFTSLSLQALFEDESEWEGHARRIVAQFRKSYGPYQGHPYFTELIEDLEDNSKQFREWWNCPELDVKARKEGPKSIWCGEQLLHLFQNTLSVKGTMDGLDVVTYDPLDLATAETLCRLIGVDEGIAEALIRMKSESRHGSGSSFIDATATDQAPGQVLSLPRLLDSPLTSSTE